LENEMAENHQVAAFIIFGHANAVPPHLTHTKCDTKESFSIVTLPLTD
jgi:hypothetical protein